MLSKEKGYARVLEIARFLGVRPPSVTQMLRKLREKGLITYKRYGVVRLTEQGEAVARRIAGRHAQIKAFLTALGVDEGSAEVDACAMEHFLHEETMEALRKIASFLLNAPSGLRCLKCIRAGKHLCLSEGL